MRVLYFGIYDPTYARNWVIINGLKKSGVEIIELREKPARFCILKLALKYFFLKENFDLAIVGFPGQEVMFLAKALIRKPIIFDAFTSHYGGYILDRKKWPENGWRASYFKFLDRWSCKLADVVLLDTQAHINFFINPFKLPASKFRRIWIGANDDNFKPTNTEHPVGAKFNVIFFGTYVPLQGTEYIIRAAKLLEGEMDIAFYFFGKGQDKTKCIEMSKDLRLKNVTFIDMMKPEDLRLKIAESDIVLGLFGNTPKTPLVIPNKVYEAVAMAKPIITADTPGIRELFGNEDLFLIPAANPRALAEAIINLKNNPELRTRIAENGHNKFIKFASTKILGAELKEIILGLTKHG